MLIGSCFADNIGERLTQSGFKTLVNPFGTLYNPASIAASLLRSISEREYTEASPEFIAEPNPDLKDALEHPLLFHSWMHHSRFSATSRKELACRANEAMMLTTEWLEKADMLIVTLGSSIIYRLRENGILVANCHKQPDALFVRERMNEYDITDQWMPLLQLLHSVNPKLRIVLTVSPIRHKRDGLHVNQLSKSVLLLAADDIVRQSDGIDAVTPLTEYFPSYEIMMDELRDYRFYAEDMIHPSPLAVEYIWERFQDTYMDSKTRDWAAKQHKEYRRNLHKNIVK